MVLTTVKIALSDNRAGKGKIPKGDTKLYSAFNGSFVNQELFPSDLLEKIKQGYAYTTQHSRYRHSDNFICGQHLALDFDTDDGRSELDFVAQDDFVKNNAIFLHTTPSHTPEKPRCRVVFVLDKPIYNKQDYADLAEALVSQFNGIDDKCKDPARFFYGAKDCKTLWIGKVLSTDYALNKLVLPFRAKKIQKERKEKERLYEIAKSRIIVSKDDVSKEQLEAHSATLLNKVSNAPDGEKYYTLRNIATTFGGYIAGGYYDYGDVVLWLQNAIRMNSGKVDSYTVADDTIEESIHYGMNKPLYFENKNDKVQAQGRIFVPELDNVHPPLSDTQKAQVVDIISDREWKLYHKILKEQNIDIGYPDSIIDHFMFGYRPRKIDDDGVIHNGAMTVPYFISTDVVGIEFRTEEENTYNGDVGLYYVKPMFSQESSFGVVLPDSMMAVNYYLSGDGYGSAYGMPHTNIALDLPQTDLYCLIDNFDNMEQLEQLAKHGAKFTKVRSVRDMLQNVKRTQLEKIATKGMKLEALI